MSGYRMAIVGATGLVGQTLLSVLQDHQVNVESLVALASEGQGRQVSFLGRDIPVEPIADMDWSRVDVAFFAAGNPVSQHYAPRAIEAGVTVIDKSSHFRMDPEVPLVVPEVNGDAIGESRLVASPNCSTIQLVVALNPLVQQFGIKRVIVSTYQAVSGTGRDAVDELRQEVKAESEQQELRPQVYPVPIAYNVLPYCDKFGEADYTGEEWKLVRETNKIFGKNVRLSATAVRVPVYVGHAESVYVETEQSWTLESIRSALLKAPSVRLMDSPSRGVIPTPRDAAGQDDVLVGRIRQDLYEPRGLHLFVVADNLRRGAATNAVEIMRTLAPRFGVEDRLS